jgi:hypothetical protein
MTPALNVQAALSETHPDHRQHRLPRQSGAGKTDPQRARYRPHRAADPRGRNGADARTRFERDIATSSIFDRLRAERPAFTGQFFAEKIECIPAR